MSVLFAVVSAPLLAFVLIVLLRRAAPWLALGGAVTTVVASAWLLWKVAAGGSFTLTVPWLPLWPLSLVATPTTALLAVTVATVSALVLVFAVGYMKHEPGRVRFFALMSLFVAAMELLVLAGDWIALLAGWELIGFCSYALIGHWHWREGVPAAASRAFLYTRSADVGLFIAVFVLVARSGSSDIATTLADGPLSTLVGLLLLLSVMGKSAQLPLQGWLQSAMVGPTPVSSLLHSATLVAAGAIVLIRMHPLLNAEVALTVAVVGGVTAVAAGIMALAATDLKRLLAASTSSQYGLMLLAVGAGYPSAALMHLVAHAAIKSSLFLQAGAFQKAYETTRLDALQGAARKQRALGAATLLSGLALAGLPPLSGMFSKDALLAAVMKSEHAGWFTALALAGVVLSGAYVGRLLRVVWKTKGLSASLPSKLWMGIGIAGLTALAVLLGPALKPAIHWATAASVPKSHWAFVAGVVAALVGLAWGGLLARPLPGRLAVWGRRGLVVAGGWQRWVAMPVMQLAQRCERMDRVVHGAVEGVAAATWRLARASRISDERGIDGLIGRLVQRVQRYGDLARGLQSGLIHRELMLTAGGTGLVLVLIVLLSL